MRKIVVVVLLAVVLPATAAAQWNFSEDVDPFTDITTYQAFLYSEENQLGFGYSCSSEGVGLLLLKIFAFGVDADLWENNFAHGHVQIRFDDDTAEMATWFDNDQTLFLPVAFVQRMAQHQTLLLGVTAYLNNSVRDRFNLTGTAAMLEQIGCRAE